MPPQSSSLSIASTDAMTPAAASTTPMTQEHATWPLVSVILSVYNRADFIVRTLDSVLRDAYPNKEIVLIDDGSSDHSKAVIESWMAEHPTVAVRFRSRPNKGLAQSTWELIHWAKGDYIVFLDSDDLIVNDGIQKRFDYLQAHPDVGLVFGDCILIDQEDRQVADSGLAEVGKVDVAALAAGEDIRKFAILNGYTTGSTQMLRKSLFNAIEGLERIRFSQDWVLTMQAAAVNQLGFCPHKVTAYRVHRGPGSQNISATPYQFKVLLENTLFCVRMWPKFPWAYRRYVTLQILHCLLHLPYLGLKMRLAQLAKGNAKGPVGRLAQGALAALVGAKKLFRRLTGALYLKHGDA